MSPAKRAQIRTSIEIVFDDDAPGWLSHLQLTRDGDQIKISVVKNNGFTYDMDPLCLAEFNKLIDTLLDP
jgi:hypothetical protein